MVINRVCGMCQGGCQVNVTVEDGKIVRVVKAGEFSTELCGGIHVENTAQLGVFKILSETSVASGVRRIEAVTSLGVLELLNSIGVVS